MSSAGWRISGQSSTAARTSPMTRSRWPRSASSSAGSVCAVDLGVDHRLGDRPVGGVGPGGRTSLQRAALVAVDGDHRVDDQVDAEAVAVQLHRHRVDQERHVVGDDLDCGVRSTPAVALELRVVDAHLRLAGRALRARLKCASAAP